MKELDYGKLGMRIRQVRKAKGWSQSELAGRCGISMSFLGHIERGTRIMSMETFANICTALDTGADELLWGVASVSDAVLDMWNQPGKGRKNQNRNNQVENNQDNRKQHNGNYPDLNVQSPESEADRETGSGKADSYAMYVRIMKSVAEIMNGA